MTKGIQLIAKVTLILAGIGLGSFGVTFLVSPHTLTSLVEIVLPSTIATMEVRGAYGGMLLGVATFFLVSAFKRKLFRAGVTALATVMGGLVLGRVIGLILDGPANAFIYALLASEVVATSVAIITLTSLHETDPIA